MVGGAASFPAFEEAEADLRAVGYDVLSPIRYGSGETWIHYMKLTIVDVLKADGIALLPRWRQARGAKLEMYIASELDIPGRWVEDWVRIARNS